MLRFEVMPLNITGEETQIPFRLTLHAVPRVDEFIRTSGNEGGHTLFKVVSVIHHTQVGSEADLAGTLMVVRNDTNSFSFDAKLS